MIGTKYSVNRCLSFRGSDLVCIELVKLFMCRILEGHSFHVALFSDPEQTHCACMRFYMSKKLFVFKKKKSTKVVYLDLECWHGWCHMKLLPSWHILRTQYNRAPCHFMQSHICNVHACLAITCHLHFWQNDWDLLRASAVTLGWNG